MNDKLKGALAFMREQKQCVDAYYKSEENSFCAYGCLLEFMRLNNPDAFEWRLNRVGLTKLYAIYLKNNSGFQVCIEDIASVYECPELNELDLAVWNDIEHLSLVQIADKLEQLFTQE